MCRVTVRLILAVFLCAAFLGCSGDKEKEKEKGSIQKMTETMGNDAARAIKDPLEKAKKAAELSEAHNKTMQEAEKNQ